MTPCFLHTPNMTNKWNDFKPNQTLVGGMDLMHTSSDEKPEPHSAPEKLPLLIHHQANPSQTSADCNPMSSNSGGSDYEGPSE
jgi:hypothetical protein